MTPFSRTCPLFAPRVSSSAIGRPIPKRTRPFVRRSSHGSSFHATWRENQPTGRVPLTRAYALYSGPRRRCGSTLRSIHASLHRRRRADQRQVAQGLREVADGPAVGGSNLLGEQADLVAVG